MNVEFVRRETAKKIIGLTELPEDGKPVTIAKNLELIDFMGMIFKEPLGGGYEMVTSVGVNSDNGNIFIYSTNCGFVYVPETGELRVASQG